MTGYPNTRKKDVIPALQRAFKGTSYPYENSIHIVEQEGLKVHSKCIDACKILGSKNIFAYVAIDYKNNESYIEIKIEDIAPENQDVITSLKEPYLKRRGKNNSIIIGVRGVGVGPQTRLTELARLFFLQDVPEHRLYISKENILANLPHNQNCIPFTEFEKRKKNSNAESSSIECQKRMQEFDYFIRQKIAEQGFILDENTGLYYQNEEYFARHLAYLQGNLKRQARQKAKILLSEKM